MPATLENRRTRVAASTGSGSSRRRRRARASTTTPPNHTAAAHACAVSATVASQAGSVERVCPAAANEPAASSAPRPVTTREVGFTGTRAAITSRAAPMTARSTERPTPAPSTWSSTPGSVIAPIPRPVERMACTGQRGEDCGGADAGGRGEEPSAGGPVAVQSEPGQDGPAPGGQQQSGVGDAAQGGGHGLPRLLALLVEQRVEEAVAEVGRRPDGEDEPAVDGWLSAEMTRQVTM